MLFIKQEDNYEQQLGDIIVNKAIFTLDDLYLKTWPIPLGLHIVSKLLIFNVHNLISTNTSTGAQKVKIQGEKGALLKNVIYIVNQELKPRRNANHLASSQGTVV